MGCMQVMWLAVATAALALSPLDPAAAPRVHVELGGGIGTATLRVPQDDAVMEAIMASSHQTAVAAGPERYDEVMEELCSRAITDRPAYWAQLWPSAIALARRLAREPALVCGRSVLEVGCGLGLGAVAASLAGASSVLATDVEPDALVFASANAAENRGGRRSDATGGDDPAVVTTALLDWSTATAIDATSVGGSALPELLPPSEDGWDAVLCADVLYDEEAPAALAALLRASVAPGGVAILTDNTDRPYESRRRDELRELLGGSFAPHGGGDGAGGRRTTVEFECRQGGVFDIEELVLRRVG